MLPCWRWLDIPGSAGERKRGCRDVGDLARMVMSYGKVVKEDERPPLPPGRRHGPCSALPSAVRHRRWLWPIAKACGRAAKRCIMMTAKKKVKLSARA